MRIINSNVANEESDKDNDNDMILETTFVFYETINLIASRKKNLELI